MDAGRAAGRGVGPLLRRACAALSAALMVLAVAPAPVGARPDTAAPAGHGTVGASAWRGTGLLDRLISRIVALDARIASAQATVDTLTLRRQQATAERAAARSAIKVNGPEVKPASRAASAAAKDRTAKAAQLATSEAGRAAAQAERDAAAQQHAEARARLQQATTVQGEAAAAEARERKGVTKAKGESAGSALVGWQMAAVATRAAAARAAVAADRASDLEVGLAAADAALSQADAGLAQAQASHSAAALAAEQTAARVAQLRTDLAQAKADVARLTKELRTLRASLRKEQPALKSLRSKRAKLEARFNRAVKVHADQGGLP